jgi:hypothetical protein
MATILPTNMQGSGARTVVQTTLTGTADTFTYVESASPVLVLFNDTGGSLSPVIDGNGAPTALPIPGAGTIDLSAGYAVGSIAAGASKAIPLVTIREFLRGTIAITGGTGLIATLYHS